MMRISGITLPDKKRADIGLTSIYGIGRALASRIIREAKIDANKKISELTTAEEGVIRRKIDAYEIEGDLKRGVANDIKRLKDIKCYRGTRHAKSLPSRGQRTKTNSRTRRGNIRKTMGTGRRKVDKK
ncbi:MAG: 30S ribosomal protein S13 [Candidatus Taylorbacteria bacterium RIFCSPLOWO2_12_FULL_47_20]|uniref:Small ribosomal subunit protein uS13 n=2 Tax=Candidatus Tayloriibacteriota TaxID=1817919 RepID=A0A1G2PAF9_9BACT|nr:MAG: 30S ribosomal protein S13 [Candidatus Taylorbacteria bacterium RIFCSPLOWO2_02_FULL_46_40]OHA45327.1 MAG: 30S ribosomal protein S13 [Candidatus Taylorbacteria bacterium RIFCSPLOWO2_12_FULL_47_20]